MTPAQQAEHDRWLPALRILGGEPKPQSDRDRDLIDHGADLAARREQDRLDEMAAADRLHDSQRARWVA